MTKEEILEELRKVDDIINRAYWAFTRQANAKPPSLVVPEAYEKRKKLKSQLSELSRKERER